VTVEESTIAGGELAPLLLGLLADGGRLSDMGRRMKELAPVRAAERICEVIAETK
jgi:UDP-N-acetylglucosamine:LPS N-acetylglucosamine transferase